jgi:DNA polymerase-1
VDAVSYHAAAMAEQAGSPTLYLVDGTSQLYRAYYALGGLTNRDGLPTHAIYGFTTMLRKLLREEHPVHLAVVFDPPGPVARHARYADYKANRRPTPDDLRVQVPYAKEVCAVLGVPVLEVAGVEADDVIASCAEQARRGGFAVVVVASDKDLLQLVGDGVTVLHPVKNVRLDPAGVAQSFGVPPERVADVLALMGDSIDNVPGVPGVGSKTALAAVQAYGDLESILRRAQRFVAVLDARDALLAAIETASAAAAQPAERLEQALEGLLAVEADLTLRARYDELLAALRRGAGELAALRRPLKELDRGSSRRVWCAMAEHADQARFCRGLVLLDRDAPVELRPEQLVLHPPDRHRARELFSALDFRTLLADLEDEAEPPSATTAGARAEEPPRILTDPEQLRTFAARCRRARRVALVVVDGGGDPLRAPLLGLALAAADGTGADAEAAYAVTTTAEPAPACALALSEVRDALGPLLEDPAVPKVGHDTKRAMHLLRRHGLDVAGWSLDTRVAAFLLQSGRPEFGLSGLVRDFLGRDLAGAAAEPGKQAATLWEEPAAAERLAGRSCREAATLVALSGALESRLAAAGLADLYATIDGPLLPVLAAIEARGVQVDVELLRRMSSEFETALQRSRESIHALAGAEFNLDSPKQLRQVLFERLGLRSRRRTAKSGEASTDAEALEELAAEHEIARELLEYRELAKLKSTYVDALPRLVNPQTGRVHTSYDPTGAATGRLSSSEPNLQNIPVRTEVGRRVRAAFVPADGQVFLAADYSQIELRVLAHLSGDSELREAFRAEEDIHRHTAARIFDVPPAQVTDDMRRRAKAVNFGILYGMSEARLAREQGLSRGEAHGFVEAYFARFRQVAAYIAAVREQARREGSVRTLFGRVRQFPQLLGSPGRAAVEQALRAAVNTTIQGTAADLMKLAMLRVERELTASGSGARMLLQVHDELLLEVPEPEVRAVAERVRRAMEQVGQLEVPLVVNQKVGASWLAVT